MSGKPLGTLVLPQSLPTATATTSPTHMAMKESASHIDGRPSTPKAGFTSPVHTPRGSPSKKIAPPGTSDLSSRFDSALKLAPNIGMAAAREGYKFNDSQSSFTRGMAEDLDCSILQDENKSPAIAGKRASRTTGPQLALSRDPPLSGIQNQAAIRDRLDDLTRLIPRSLPPGAMEKLQKPSVKRLANVTQLYFLDYYFDLLSYIHGRQTRFAAFQDQNPKPPATPDPQYNATLKQYLGRERAFLRKRRTRLRYGDFQILTQVGQGGYGQVYLAQKKDTREVCALKVMSKKLLFKMDEVRHVLTERDILTNSQSEWLVRLLYAFQDERSIYLAMEYVPGGDFRTLLNNTGVLHNRYARFYIAEMFMCVDALHQLGYIHRDLKPENFLIDSLGHVKLTDFGLAAGMLVPQKIESMRVRLEQVGNTPVPFGLPAATSAGMEKDIADRTAAERRTAYRALRAADANYAKSIVGSPDYMAPEVLQGRPYEFTVDYWSLGCMLFEALAGYPPFAGATPDETWRNLKDWERVFQRPVYEDPNYYLSKRTWSLICRCINHPAQRFHSISEVKQHAYFSEVQWESLRDPRSDTRPPFVPELDGETDAGYFDDFDNEADMKKYKEVHEKQRQVEDMIDRGDAMKKALWVGFTFRHRKTVPVQGGEHNEDSLVSGGKKEFGRRESDFGTIL